MDTTYTLNIRRIIVVIIFLFSIPVFAQDKVEDLPSPKNSNEKNVLDVDTTKKNFMPLAIGNTWQYTNPSNDILTRKVVKDSIIDGKHYFIIEGSYLRTIGKIIRIDSLMRIQERLTYTVGDTCGSLDSNEMSIYHLDENAGAFWKICSRFYEMLTNEPMVMFGREYQRYMNGELKGVIEFYFGGILDSKDTVFAEGATFVEGIGLVEEHTFEGNYNKLTGAIINGIHYGNIVSVDNSFEPIPQELTLYHNYPNPFNPATTIEFNLPYKAEVKISIYDILGQQIEILYEGSMSRGNHKFKWDAKGLSSGTYFARININSQNQQPFIKTIKMMLTK